MMNPCPRCKKQIEYSTENVFRPFCSQRCRDVDLGAWLTGENAIPGENIETIDVDNEPADDESDDLKH